MTIEDFRRRQEGGQQGRQGRDPGSRLDGRLGAATNATYSHSLIQANLAVIIGSRLIARKSPFRLAVEAPVVSPFSMNDNGLRVPDLSVTNLPVGDGSLSPDPVLIIEILSAPDLEASWDNVRACANIGRVREILVVDAEGIGAQLFRRGAKGEWPVKAEQLGARDTIALASIDLAFPLIAAYAGTPLA